jgi:hypothetical protein
MDNRCIDDHAAADVKPFRFRSAWTGSNKAPPRPLRSSRKPLAKVAVSSVFCS